MHALSFAYRLITNNKSDLKDTAYTKDCIIMSVSHKSLSIYGVQFYPESITTNLNSRLLKLYSHYM